MDISRIFPNFDADKSDPANYFFEHKDQLLLAIDRLGAKPIYRLGESIDHSIFKRYARPPKDFEKWTRICVNIIRHYNEGWAGGFTLGISYWEIWNEPDLGNEMWDGGTAQQYRDLYKTAAAGIKALDPSLKVGAARSPASWTLRRTFSGSARGKRFPSTSFPSICITGEWSNWKAM